MRQHGPSGFLAHLVNNLLSLLLRFELGCRLLSREGRGIRGDDLSDSNLGLEGRSALESFQLSSSTLLCNLLSGLVSYQKPISLLL